MNMWHSTLSIAQMGSDGTQSFLVMGPQSLDRIESQQRSVSDNIQVYLGKTFPIPTCTLCICKGDSHLLNNLGRMCESDCSLKHTFIS